MRKRIESRKLSQWRIVCAVVSASTACQPVSIPPVDSQNGRDVVQGGERMLSRSIEERHIASNAWQLTYAYSVRAFDDMRLTLPPWPRLIHDVTNAGLPGRSPLRWIGSRKLLARSRDDIDEYVDDAGRSVCFPRSDAIRVGVRNGALRLLPHRAVVVCASYANGDEERCLFVADSAGFVSLAPGHWNAHPHGVGRALRSLTMESLSGQEVATVWGAGAHKVANFDFVTNEPTCAAICNSRRDSDGMCGLFVVCVERQQGLTTNTVFGAAWSELVGRIEFPYSHNVRIDIVCRSTDDIRLCDAPACADEPRPQLRVLRWPEVLVSANQKGAAAAGLWITGSEHGRLEAFRIVGSARSSAVPLLLPLINPTSCDVFLLTRGKDGLLCRVAARHLAGKGSEHVDMENADFLSRADVMFVDDLRSNFVEINLKSPAIRAAATDIGNFELCPGGVAIQCGTPQVSLFLDADKGGDTIVVDYIDGNGMIVRSVDLSVAMAYPMYPRTHHVPVGRQPLAEPEGPADR